MALARLRDGTSMAQAQSEMDAIAEGLALIHPMSDDGWGVELVPIRELVLGHFETPLLTLLGGAALLLAIGCANVASLLLVRVSGRRRELSLRLALGASRARVARLLVLESLVLVAAGGFDLAHAPTSLHGTDGHNGTPKMRKMARTNQFAGSPKKSLAKRRESSNSGHRVFPPWPGPGKCRVGTYNNGRKDPFS